jgi:Cullin binding
MDERHAEFKVRFNIFIWLVGPVSLSLIAAKLAYNFGSVTNNEDLKAKLLDMEESLQDERQFKDFYSFVFPFAKTKTQKSMDVEVS